MSKTVQLTSVSRDDIRDVFVDWLQKALSGEALHPMQLLHMSNDEIVDAQTEFVWSRICNLQPQIVETLDADELRNVDGFEEAVRIATNCICEKELAKAVNALGFDSRLNMYDHRIAEMIFKKVGEMRQEAKNAQTDTSNDSADDLFKA